jgi:hypothetical protein
MSRIRTFALLVGSFALIVGLLGSGGIVTAQDAQEFPVTIRFVNAMTALDTVDVYINGEGDEHRVAEGLAYGTVSDAFTGTAPATGVLVKQNINIGFDRYLYDTIVPTEAGKEYLVVISDLILIPTVFDQSATGADMARARVINAAAQSPALDIYATASGDVASPASGDVASPVSVEPIITDVGFGKVTEAGELPAGAYEVSATATGTDTVALEASSVTLDASQAYVLVIYGKPGDTDTPMTVLSVSAPTQA